LPYQDRKKRSSLTPPGAAQASSKANSDAAHQAAAYIVPPPRRRASPTGKKIGRVCSTNTAIQPLNGAPRNACEQASTAYRIIQHGVSPGKCNIHSDLRGDMTARARGYGLRGRKKTPTSCRRFFLLQGGIPPPDRRARRTLPAQIFDYVILSVARFQIARSISFAPAGATCRRATPSRF